MKYNKEICEAYNNDDEKKFGEYLSSQEPLALLLASIQIGNFYNESAILSGICEDTFYTWKKDKNKPEFSEALKKANARCEQFHIKNIRDASEKNWQASAWMLERKYKERWSSKTSVELSGEVTNDGLTKEQKEKLNEFFDKK